jgi:hypothetical protein
VRVSHAPDAAFFMTHENHGVALSDDSADVRSLIFDGAEVVLDRPPYVGLAFGVTYPFELRRGEMSSCTSGCACANSASISPRATASICAFTVRRWRCAWVSVTGARS